VTICILSKKIYSIGGGSSPIGGHYPGAECASRVNPFMIQEVTLDILVLNFLFRHVQIKVDHRRKSWHFGKKYYYEAELILSIPVTLSGLYFVTPVLFFFLKRLYWFVALRSYLAILTQWLDALFVVIGLWRLASLADTS